MNLSEGFLWHIEGNTFFQDCSVINSVNNCPSLCNPNILLSTIKDHYCKQNPKILKPINMIIMAINNIFRAFIRHYQILHQSQDYFDNFYLHDSDIALSLLTTCSLIQNATANIICSDGM